MPTRALSALLAALVALGAAACSDRPKPPPVPTGEAFRINPERWAAANPPAAARREQP